MKYPDRVFEFVDWMASNEYNYYTPGSAGIKGLNWDIENGKPILTEFGYKCMDDGTTQMPEEYGGGGNSGIITAFGVWKAMKAVAKELFGDDSLKKNSLLLTGPPYWKVLRPY